MSRDAAWPWSVLGLERMPAHTGDIRRAYARALKAIDQAKDIEGFVALRQAYEQGMAIRENKTEHANARKTARTETVVKAAAGVDLAPPRHDPPDLPEPARDPRAEMVRAMLRELAKDYPDSSTPSRIQAVLKIPVDDAPELDREIRYSLASLIRRKFSAGFHEGELSPEVTPEVLLALDARYSWLSDYTAFRGDFWGNAPLQHAMTMRAFGEVARPIIAAVPSRHGKVWDWCFRQRVHFGLVYFIVLLQFALHVPKSPLTGATLTIVGLVLALPLVLAVMFESAIVRRVFGLIFSRARLWLMRSR
jgi:hypothetical protein